jgi:myotubularin-related protein 10/11/12
VLSQERPMCESGLPQHFVVPKSFTDSEYLEHCESFRCKRAAIWVWSLGNASLVRMADLLPDLINNPKEHMPSKENLMLEYIRNCSETKAQPRYLELTKVLPSLQDVQISYMKFRALCVPVSDRELTEQDDKTCWLLYVSLCLKTANEAAGSLKAGTSVALQENDGRDMCCLVSSLVQMFLDPFYRTITGFQVLIQKEWVALGHPFSDRMGHVYSKQAEKSPIFLLFLDCVWQVLQQFPESFEFTETFLTTIWDAVFLPVFDTFQFNSEYDRCVAVRDVSCSTNFEVSLDEAACLSRRIFCRDRSGIGARLLATKTSPSFLIHFTKNHSCPSRTSRITESQNCHRVHLNCRAWTFFR